MEHHSSTSARESDKKDTIYKDKVMVGLDNIPSIYNVKQKLEGVGWNNMRFIRSETGGTAVLKGQSGKEPLYINIEHRTLDGLRRTRRLIVDLVKSVYEDLQQSCPASITRLLCLPPHLDDDVINAPSPPPDKQTVDDDSSGSLKKKWNTWRDNSVTQVAAASENKKKRKRNKKKGPMEKKSKQDEIKQGRLNAGKQQLQDTKQNWLPPTQVNQNYPSLIAKERLLAPPQPFTAPQPAPVVNRALPTTQQLSHSPLSNALNELKQKQQSAAHGPNQPPTLQPSAVYGPSLPPPATLQPKPQPSAGQGFFQSTPQPSVGFGPSLHQPAKLQPKPQPSAGQGFFQTTPHQSASRASFPHRQPLPQPNKPGSVEITTVLHKIQQVASLLENTTTGLLNKRMNRVLQFVPEQMSDARGKPKKGSAQRERDEQMKMCFGHKMFSGAIKTEKVTCRAKQMLVWLMPENGESLYSALACCLFGPFRSVFELNEMAASLHTCAVRYIRRNISAFSTDLKNLYNRIFPNHGLNTDSTYEHCSLYLMKPSHEGEGICMRAIARMFSTSIIVRYEDGQELTRYDPVPLSSIPPITIVRRIRSEGYHFDPVVDCTSELVLPSPVPPPKPNLGPELMSVGRMLNVVTWDVRVCSNTEVQCIVDEALSTKDIDLACIQGTLPPQTSLGKALTTHFKWWFKVHTDKPSPGVAILVNRNCEGTVSNFVSLSESLVSLDFNYKKNNFAIIGCHLPESFDVKYNMASAELINALNRVPPSYQTFLLGQFNAQIGTMDIKSQERHLIGHRLYHHDSNTNGMLLKQLAINRNLRIITTVTNDKGTPVTYWANKNSLQNGGDPLLLKQQMSQISYILIKNWVNILEVHNFSWWEACSDHAVVGCSIALIPYSPLMSFLDPK